MRYHRTSEHALQEELRAIARRFSDLADNVRDAVDRRSGDGRAMARQAGRQLVRLGDEARDAARQHPAMTGLTVAAVVGVAALVTVACLRNSR